MQGLTAFLEKNISGTNSRPASHPEVGSEGRARARESMALVRVVSGGAPGGAAPLRHWGARASQRRAAARVMGRRALRYWARRLPALHSLVSRETEKGEGR